MNSTSSIIYNKAIEFFSLKESQPTYSYRSNKINNVEFKLRIPIIQKMCNFNVNSFILIEKNFNNSQFTYKFEIHSKKIKLNESKYYKFFSFEQKYLSLSIKYLNKFIKYVKDILPKLYFNKLLGIFEFDCVKNKNLINFSNSEINNILGLDIFGLKYSNCSGECCICYDKTITKTSCNHFICVECWTNINEPSICPYCRCKKIKICLFDNAKSI